MKSAFLRIIVIVFYTNISIAQKQIIDSNTYASWPSLGAPILTDDGRYVMYRLENVPIGSQTLVLQSTDGKWKKEFTGGLINYGLVPNSNHFLYKEGTDVAMLSLGTDIIKQIPNVYTFQLQEWKKNNLLCYYRNDQSNTYVVRNLKTGKEQIYNNVVNARFSRTGSVLILYASAQNHSGEQEIIWVDMNTNKQFKIWKGENIDDLTIDEYHQQLTFKQGKSIWHYKVGFTNAKCIVSNNGSTIENGFALRSIDHFSKDGARLFVSLSAEEGYRPSGDAVEVWSYTDIKLPSEQRVELTTTKVYMAVIDLANGSVTRLQQNDMDGILFPEAVTASDTLALLISRKRWQEAWNINSKPVFSLLSTKNGEKRELHLPAFPAISSNGKYLCYFDDEQRNYYCYEIATGIVRNLTSELRVNWSGLERNDLERKESPRGILGWLNDDKAVLIYDQYDIWQLDPSCKQNPINITNGYGYKNRVVLWCINNEINRTDNLILTGFDTENKNNGFYSKQFGEYGDPTLLTTGAYIYCINNSYFQTVDFTPVRAKSAKIYIVRRMSATEAPNYYSTRDFKTFNRLSDLHPERKYNWYTTELHKWTSFDSSTLHGLLYKPEDFDSNKKYPVIFYYYERLSDGLNAYLKPSTSGNGLNIPTLVSNGYLVFCPDIHYTIGDPMKGTYDAVVSAATYVSRFSFVNPKKMGIQGSSWGGQQTNYLVTHTNLFAAANANVGAANLVAWYGSLYGESTGSGLQNYLEGGQGRMGDLLWCTPELYINNSSVYNADKVSTPLLMMYNRKDSMNYRQGIEFFLDLRRLGKRVWLLSYPNGGHGVYGKDGNDFSFRMMQFFDHYLKDKPAPVWMTKGIPASRRGIDNGYEYDLEINTPGPGLLTPAQQAKADSLMNRKPLTVTIR